MVSGKLPIAPLPVGPVVAFEKIWVSALSFGSASAIEVGPVLRHGCLSLTMQAVVETSVGVIDRMELAGVPLVAPVLPNVICF